METFARGRQVGPGELAQIRTARARPAGVNLDIAPSEQALREVLAEGRCPFCGLGPFRLLGGHTGRVHGYSTAELRELAGLLKGHPLCSPDVSETRRAHRAGRKLPASAYDGRAAVKRTMSEAGKRSNRARLDATRSVEQQRAASAASARATRARNAQLYAEIVRRYRDGGGMVEIAAALHVAPKTVRDTLQRERLLTVDGRTARWQR